MQPLDMNDIQFSIKEDITNITNAHLFKRSHLSKATDCIFVVGLLVIGGLMEQQIIIQPNKQYIPGDEANDNFSYPNIKETVSTLMMILSAALPWYTLFIFN
eukprot:307436_1